MLLKMRRLTLLVSALLVFFNFPSFAYDIEDWKRLPNDNPEHVRYYEKTITIRIAIVGSIETLRSEWFKAHGTRLKENTFCLSVAGGGTVPEIWVQAKEVDGEIWLETVCFGHELIHIFKTEGLDVISPDRSIK